MRAITYVGPRTLCLTVAGGIMGGVAAWLILPFPAARMRIADVAIVRDGGGPQLALSRDCRFVATTHGSGAFGNGFRHHWQGELRVWDTHQRRMIFALPYEEVHSGEPGISVQAYKPTEPVYSVAFTPEGDKLIKFGRGRAKFHVIPSGAPWEPEVTHDFPYEAGRLTSRLVTDVAGNLLVLIRDNEKKRITIRDLWTAKEIGAWDVDPRASSQDLGGVMLEVSEFPSGAPLEAPTRVLRVRELPSGKLHPPLEKGDIWPGLYEGPKFAATLDGLTVVALNGSGPDMNNISTVLVWTNGAQKQLQIDASGDPTLSPDGRLLAANTHSRPFPLDSFAIFDLTTGRALEHFPDARSAHFSLDGKTLAVVTSVQTRVYGDPDRSLNVYDLPLGYAWKKVIAVALVCASVIFAAGQWVRWRQRKRRAVSVVSHPTPSPT